MVILELVVMREVYGNTRRHRLGRALPESTLGREYQPFPDLEITYVIRTDRLAGIVDRDL